MAILNILTDVTGLAGVNPAFIYVDTDNTIAEVSVSGFLNPVLESGYDVTNKKMALVATKLTPSSLVSSTNLYTIDVTNGIITLTELSGGGGVTFPITVPEGGTDLVSLTPYTLIAGGTTSTGAMQQVASLGTSGQFLQSNGPGALPTWASATGSGTVNSGTINDLAWYASTGTAVSALTTANSSGLLTNGTGVPAWVAYVGTGAPVLATSPTLVTPVIGVASATSINFGGGPLSVYTPFTPFTSVITCTTPGDLNVVYNLASSNYSRIGSIVTLVVSLDVTITHTTASGTLILTGFPVPANSSLLNIAVGVPELSGITYPAGTTWLKARLSSATPSNINFVASGSAINPATTISITDWASGTQGDIGVTITYLA